MNKYFLIGLLFLTVFSQPIFSQDFKSQFEILFDKNDVAGQQKLLSKWEKSRPEDVELYVSYFNFYFKKSQSEVLNLSSTKTKNSVQITKEDDKNIVAYLTSQKSFDKANFDYGISYIDKGIAKFPNRLDMRFGKIYALGQIENYKAFTGEIVKTIEYSNINKNQWLWMNDKPVENSKKLLLSSIQDYVGQIFDAGDDQTDNIKIIAETVLKYYPDSVENLSNLSVYYMLKEDFDNALIPLLKAEKLAPTDYIIIGNIAWAYYKKGDKTNALKYYELLLKHGNDKAKAMAKEKIAELNKKD